MKTIVDYLKEHKKYEHDVMDADFELELKGEQIKLRQINIAGTFCSLKKNKQKVALAITDNPPHWPSIPSMRFTAFVTPIIQTKVKGYAKIPRFTV